MWNFVIVFVTASLPLNYCKKQLGLIINVAA
jgi:hypothetical protein